MMETQMDLKYYRPISLSGLHLTKQIAMDLTLRSIEMKSTIDTNSNHSYLKVTTDLIE